MRRSSAVRFVFALASFCFLAAPDLAKAQSVIRADEGLAHVDWQDARQVVDQIALVSGTLVDVGQAGSVNFLNFDRRRRDVFKVVIFRDDLPKFSGRLADLYLGKQVVVRGLVTLYKNVPQIQVSSPDQIQLLEQLPPYRAASRPVRRAGQQIRIATLNVQNLFDDVDDPYRQDDSTPAKPRQELVRLAATMTTLNADVLALQEVENRGYLERFVEVFLRDQAYEVVHYEGNDRRGIDVALLTRLPIGAVTSHRHRTFVGPDGERRRFSRDLLSVQLLPADAPPFEVWVVHLKSKRGEQDQTEAIRMAEVGQIREQIESKLAATPRARICLVGDFNDTRDSRPLRHLVNGSASGLRSFWDELPADAVTYHAPPFADMIDFILASPAMAERYVPRSYRILTAPHAAGGSDHYPVAAEFSVGSQP